MDREIMQHADDQLNRSGYRTIFLKSGEKTPAFKGWMKRDPLSDHERQFWWRRRSFNIGIDLRDGLLVADVDSPEVLEWIEGNWVVSPARARTQRGFHLYYKRSFPFRTRLHYLGMPLDLLATMACAPPSWLAKTEFRYQWEGFLTKADLPEFQEEWLIREEPKHEPKIQRWEKPTVGSGVCRYAEAALHYEVQNVATAQEGTRNATLNRAAFCLGGLVAAGVLSQQAVETALTDAALTAGLGEREIAATLKSGLTAGMKRPREMKA